MVSPETEAAAARNFGRRMWFALAIGAVSGAIGVAAAELTRRNHHRATHHHVTAWAQVLVIALPILILLGLVAVWYFGRQRSWFKPSPLWALDRPERKKAWRAATRGEPLAPDIAPLVVAQAIKTYRGFQWAWWMYLVLTTLGIVNAIAAHGRERWLQLLAAVAFLAIGVATRRQRSVAQRVLRRYGNGGPPVAT